MVMYCDHEPLAKAFYSSTQRDNARECRHLSEIASLCTNLKYIKECDNVVAYALSREEIAAMSQHAAQIDWNDFAKSQQNDFVLKRYLDETDSANVAIHEWHGVKLLCDVSRDGVPCPLVPCGFRRIIFDNCHNLTHSGLHAAIKFISETCTWPIMKKDCTMWVQSCVPFQQTKVRPYTKSPYQHYPLTSERLSEIRLDLIGPLPESVTFLCVIVTFLCVDRFTR